MRGWQPGHVDQVVPRIVVEVVENDAQSLGEEADNRALLLLGLPGVLLDELLLLALRALHACIPPRLPTSPPCVEEHLSECQQQKRILRHHKTQMRGPVQACKPGPLKCHLWGKPHAWQDLSDPDR